MIMITSTLYVNQKHPYNNYYLGILTVTYTVSDIMSFTVSLLSAKPYEHLYDELYKMTTMAKTNKQTNEKVRCIQ